MSWVALLPKDVLSALSEADSVEAGHLLYRAWLRDRGSQWRRESWPDMAETFNSIPKPEAAQP